jgi:hypothetical protein
MTAVTPLRRRILLSGVVVTVLALSPAAALGKAKRITRPLAGMSMVTATVDLRTGKGPTDGTFVLSRLGRGTLHADSSGFTLTGSTFVFSDTVTLVAANGDKVFATDRGTGTVTPTGITLSIVGSITGGTGRFAGATGKFTITSRSVGATSYRGPIASQTYADTWRGEISFRRGRRNPCRLGRGTAQRRRQLGA